MMQNPKLGTWELPGGRIDVGEENIPAKEILSRELHEELGSDLKVEIKEPITTWMIPWKAPRLGEHVFAIGFFCEYRAGDVKISEEHRAFQWMSPTETKKVDLVPGYAEALDYFWKTR